MDLKKFIHKHILKRKYYRYGSCRRCGACCSKIYVNHKKDIIKSEEEFEKLKKLHPFYTYIEIVDKDENGLVFKCNKFDKEKRICTIHKIRPAICRKYPSEEIFKMGAVMAEDCGFYFEPIETFKEVFAREAKKHNRDTV